MAMCASKGPWNVLAIDGLGQCVHLSGRTEVREVVRRTAEMVCICAWQKDAKRISASALALGAYIVSLPCAALCSVSSRTPVPPTSTEEIICLGLFL